MAGRTWLRAALALWGIAFGLALLGVLLDAGVLRGLGLLVGRGAVAATIVWAALAAVAALRRRVRPGPVGGRLRK